MNENQRSYKIRPITINKVKVTEVVIDAHYEARHSDYMNDELILKLVRELNGRFELPEMKKGKYSYFATLVVYKEKQY